MRTRVSSASLLASRILIEMEYILHVDQLCLLFIGLLSAPNRPRFARQKDRKNRVLKVFFNCIKTDGSDIARIRMGT